MLGPSGYVRCRGSFARECLSPVIQDPARSSSFRGWQSGTRMNTQSSQVKELRVAKARLGDLRPPIAQKQSRLCVSCRNLIRKPLVLNSALNIQSRASSSGSRMIFKGLDHRGCSSLLAGTPAQSRAAANCSKRPVQIVQSGVSSSKTARVICDSPVQVQPSRPRTSEELA